MNEPLARTVLLLIVLACVAPQPGMADDVVDEQAAASAAGEFFESRIRPALIEYCLECHASDTEASGGLLLDSKLGWESGGDSGVAIVRGKPTESRLWQAISYENPDLQMPPDGKLPQDVIDAFSQWIKTGAFDPRTGSRPLAKPQTGLPVEQAQEHWAYRDLLPVTLPSKSAATATSPVDQFIDRQLEAAGLSAAPVASQDVLVRRLYFDLWGLPPSHDPFPLSNVQPSDDSVAYARLVDRLLDTPQFGEHFARKWMDVARYAESITLRGFVLPEAWRYRDYLVEAFTADRPFDQMIREQIAGDLLQADDVHERQLQVTATAFLAMGNTNLEQQDKSQLEMDFIDEQLEVIGRAFLGQTIGCARCHDHKFDPIPTRDYYALAGILRSAVALKHENVSKWIEQPLPLGKAEREQYEQWTESLAELDKQIASLKKRNSRQLADQPRMIPVSDLEGVVVDSRDAKLVGTWIHSTFVGRLIGDGYIHDDNRDQGQKTATFEPANLPPGEYQVRLAYSSSSNRASNAIVRVFSADGEATVQVNQKLPPPEEGVWFSLGTYRFEKDGQAFVLVSNENANGHVIVDAVQFLPIDQREVAAGKPGNQQRVAQADNEQAAQQAAELSERLKKLEALKKELTQQIAKRPRYLTVIEGKATADIAIHIRGDVHNLGEIVPRGFLTAIPVDRSIRIDPQSSGRLELADWLSSSRNPLTARVYANRVWSWLMGQGIVASVNNFGTTGFPPSHPELLDWLAGELIRSGWSTKHLVRLIVMSDAYRRQVVAADPHQSEVDPANRLYWRGHSRRLSVESMRDAMLSISGELDTTVGGSLIRPGTKADYNYQHSSTRRSLYHPVLRNSLPELFEAFDFADTSVSVGQRPRSTVATQALVLMNHPWVATRAQAAANRTLSKYALDDQPELIRAVYQKCFHREPTAEEFAACSRFLQNTDTGSERERLTLLIHSLFAAIDFRFLE